MQTERVHSIDSLNVSLLEINPPILQIIAKGTNGNNNCTNIRLEPRVYIVPPSDGIWEFDFVCEMPPIVDDILTKVEAQYEWKNLPETVKGVKIHAASNSKIMLLSKKDKAAPAALAKIELLKAEAWVNVQPVQSTAGGTLNVDIVYNSNNPGFHSLKKVVPQGFNPNILIL